MSKFIYFTSNSEKKWKIHCVKSVRICSFSGLYFPAFGLSRNTQNMDTFQAVIGRIQVWWASFYALTLHKKNEVFH